MKLEIRDVSGMCFKANDGSVHVKSRGSFAFFVEGKGYLKFKDVNTPYTPLGGKKSLQSIIDLGGPTSYENIEFVNPI